MFEACASDNLLEQIIKSRQDELRDKLANIEESRKAIANGSLNDSSVRLKNFELFEAERRIRDHLRSELIDLLKGAHIEGFESLKKLMKLYGSKNEQVDQLQYEQYIKVQREAADLMLSGKVDFPSHLKQVNKPKTLLERLRDPENPESIAARLKTTIDTLKRMNLHDHKETFTLEHLTGLVRVVQDATFANCAYRSSGRVEHVGGGTDPRLLEGLFARIHQTYLGS